MRYRHFWHDKLSLLASFFKIIINNIRLIESSQNARQPQTRPTSATQDSYTYLGLSCHAGQPMVLDQRWAAAGSGLRQPPRL